MTTLALYGGPLKRVIINRAYGLNGQSVTEFELSPEDYTLGLQAMDSIAATFPDALGYNFPINGTDGTPEEESGISAADVQGFIVLVAQELSANIGTKFTPNRPQTVAALALGTKYQSIPLMQLGRQVPRGAGNRWRNGPLPFFVPDISTAEVEQ